MNKLSIFIFILFLGVVALFAISNQEAINIKIPFGKIYEISKIALLLFSSAIGALTMLIIFAIRDTKRFIDNWQYQKKQKKETEVQELYSKALNSLLAQNEDEAKEFLKGVLSKEPEHLNALLRLGDVALSEEDFQKAAEYYQKARNLNPQNLEALFSLERFMEKTGRWPDALNYIEDIIEIDDENLSALYKKRQNLIGYKYEYGRQSLEGGELEKAKKAFKTVLRLEKNFIPATLGLAEVLLREGENEEAINLLEKSYEETSSMDVLARLEDLLINVGEPGRLIRIYKGSLSRNPQDPVIRFFLVLTK